MSTIINIYSAILGASNGLFVDTDTIKLGGSLIEPTTITTDATNTLAIAGLQSGSTSDRLVISDPSTGVLKYIDSSSFIYTADNGITLTGNNFQLGGPLVQNTTITTGGFDLTFAQESSRIFVVGNDGTLKAFDTEENPRLQYSPTFYNSGAGLAINALGTSAITPTATLHVRGTNTATNYTANFENSAAQRLMAWQDGGVISIGNAGALSMYPFSSNIPDINGTNLTWDSRTTTEVANDGAFRFNGSLSFSATSGAQYVVGVKKGFAPTSGTATFAGLFLNSTINQTGGSTGITRGIYSNQVLTSAYNYQAFYFSQSAAYAPNAAVTDYYYSAITPKINASVNNQTITGLDITLSGSDGAFTGVTRYALRLTGGSLNVANLAGTATRIPSLNSSGTFGQLSGTGVIRMTGTTVAFDTTVMTSAATAGFVPYMTSSTETANSGLYWTGTNLGLGTTTITAEMFRMKRDQNADTSVRLENGINGTAARSIFAVGASSVGISMISALSNYTGVTSWANSGILTTDTGLSNGLILRSGAGNIRFQPTGLADMMVLTSSAQLGINKSTANATLDVNGASYTLYTSGFYLANGATMRGRWYDNNAGSIIMDRIATTDMVWQQAGATQLTLVGSTGNLVSVASIQTGKPTGGTAQAMRFGSVTTVTDASLTALGIVNQQRVQIGSTVYYIPLSAANTPWS